MGRNNTVRFPFFFSTDKTGKKEPNCRLVSLWRIEVIAEA